MYGQVTGKSLTIPRGTPDLNNITLDMTSIYEAESRLHEVRAVNPVTAPELMGYFNNACNTTTKYLAWVEYEILQAQKFLKLAKSIAILEKAPVAYQKQKTDGVKYNEDFRDAIVNTDPDYQKRLDVLNALTATKVLLEGKVWSFVRAYNACKFISKPKNTTAASPNLNGTIGQTYDEPQENFMGKTKLD